MESPSTRPPSVGRRIACMAYEGLLLVGVLSVAFLLPQVGLGIGFNVTLPGWLLILHVFTVVGCYFIWHWRHGGQTLAMQTWKIQLSALDGAQPSMVQLLLRYVLAWFSLTALGVGILWALFDRDQQFLHDRLAGTRLTLKTL